MSRSTKGSTSNILSSMLTLDGLALHDHPVVDFGDFGSALSRFAKIHYRADVESRDDASRKRVRKLGFPVRGDKVSVARRRAGVRAVLEHSKDEARVAVGNFSPQMGKVFEHALHAKKACMHLAERTARGKLCAGQYIKCSVMLHTSILMKLHEDFLNFPSFMKIRTTVYVFLK